MSGKDVPSPTLVSSWKFIISKPSSTISKNMNLWWKCLNLDKYKTMLTCLRIRILWREKKIFIKIRNLVTSGNLTLTSMNLSVDHTCFTKTARWLSHSCLMRRLAKSKKTKSESISSLINLLQKSSVLAGSTAKCWFHISKSSLKCKLSTSISSVKFGAISIITLKLMIQTLSKPNKKLKKKRKTHHGLNSTTHLEKKPILLWPAL